MPQLVVHRLEAVQVDEEHAHATIVSPRARDRLLQPVREERSVGESGQRVELGEMSQPRLGLALLGQVAYHGEVRGGLGEPQRPQHPAVPPVGAEETHLDGGGARRIRRGEDVHLGPERRPILVLQEVDDAAVAELPLAEAHDSPAGGADAPDDGVDVEHADHVEREREEPVAFALRAPEALEELGRPCPQLEFSQPQPLQLGLQLLRRHSVPAHVAPSVGEPAPLHLCWSSRACSCPATGARWELPSRCYSGAASLAQ